jgi:predicted Zn-dependent peptidase
MNKPQVTTLANGLRVVTQHMDAPQVYTNFATNVGARHETAAESGISHVLEHMLCMDTERYSIDEKVEAVDNMYGTFNATTSYEKTDYHYQVSKEFTEDAVELLADGILRSKLDPDRVRTELGAVQEERRAGANNPARNNYHMMLKNAFPGSGLDRQIIGTEETINTHEREQLLAFMKDNYSADKMVLTVVGDVKHEDIVAMAEKHFADLPTIPKDQQRSEIPAVYRGGMQTMPSEESQQVSLQIGFHGGNSRDAHQQAVDELLSGIIGGGFSGRLMKNLRTDKGLVYGAGAGNHNFNDNGVFYVQAALNGDNAAKATAAICEEIVRATKDLSQRELDKTRNSTIGEYQRASTNPAVIGSSLAAEMTTTGKASTIDEGIEELKSVTLEEVQARAKEIFASAPTVVAYGKGVENIPSYEEITTMLGHPRELDASGLVKEGVPSAQRAAASAKIAGKPAEQQREVA